MASEQHQRLVNELARVLEEQKNVTITHVDIDGTPEFFDQKYKTLPVPKDHGGIPDLQGKDTNGVIHLGEAEIDINDSNLDAQLEAFSNRVMNNSKKSIPFHIIVPKGIRDEMEKKIRQLGLGAKLDSGETSLWS